ncbi:hypothetical protein C2G38_2073542 [Gigaspora rosea]|uniref:BAH domain-containing protein n=1 Tax=Gigaspora rosea TaxID=44941 RepID=A0A397VPE5_9GLOM|nr:hypothetical protein C2G38_2073542 [Gigaspora rosea]
MGWYITEDLYPETVSEEGTGIASEDPRIINIRVRQQLTNAEIKSSRLTSCLDDNNTGTTLRNGLFTAYSEYMKERRYIKTRFIKLYRYIRYTLLDDDGEYYVHIKLHIGNMVTIKEEDNESYAMVRAIFTHKYNNGIVYAFVWIDWLNDIGCTDSLLRCPIFERQTDSDTRWYRIYPISMLNDIPKVHFVHACHSSCSAISHDNNNVHYFMNKFFYKMV